MADDVTLVTGASGFLGKAVVKQLADISQHTIGLDPRPSATTQVVDNLSDRSRLKALLNTEKVTHIIHAGGVSGPMVLADDPVEVIAINVLGSLNLLYAAMEAESELSSIVRRRPLLAVFMKTNRSTNNIPYVPTTPTALRKPQWKWCCVDCGAKFPWTHVRCVSP